MLIVFLSESHLLWSPKIVYETEVIVLVLLLRLSRQLQTWRYDALDDIPASLLFFLEILHLSKPHELIYLLQQLLEQIY